MTGTPGSTWRKVAENAQSAVNAAYDRVKELEAERDRVQIERMRAENVAFELFAYPWKLDLTANNCDCGDHCCNRLYADKQTQLVWLAWWRRSGLPE